MTIFAFLFCRSWPDPAGRVPEPADDGAVERAQELAPPVDPEPEPQPHLRHPQPRLRGARHAGDPHHLREQAELDRAGRVPRVGQVSLLF